MPIIEGKKVVNLPSATTKEIVAIAGEKRPHRKAIIERPEGNVTISDHVPTPLRPDDKVKLVPDRVKAHGFTFGGRKTAFQKDLIFDQVSDIEQKFFKTPIEIDRDFNWILIPKFRLPEAWAKVNNSKYTKLMIIIPDQFPNLPPNGFYLPNTVVQPSGDNHFFSRAYDGAFGQHEDEARAMQESGWMWYCTHIKPQAWSPARIRELSDWRRGDNLWDVMNIIVDVLTNPYED